MSIYDIRECSSKRNSYDEDGNRMRLREVISEIDDSCESSAVSSVVERVQFGRRAVGR